MRPRNLLPLLALLSGSACASAGGGPSSSPPLAYRVPAGGAATFHQADTVGVSVDVNGQSIDVSQTTTATVDMTFTEAPEGMRVSATYAALDARVSNPMTGTQSASADDVEGPLVFTVDPRGAGTLVSGPQLSGSADELFNAAVTAATFFPRLPDRVVAVGDTWTDTIQVEAPQGPGEITTSSAVTYTLAGDTTVAGRRMRRVTYTSDDQRTVSTRQQGMDIEQDLDGTSNGWFLWDVEAGTLWEQYSDGTYTGTMNVPQAPFPMGLRIRATSHLTRGGG